MKKRVILLFSIVPFLIGYFFAYLHGKPITQGIAFSLQNILPTDNIVLSINGDIYQINNSANNQITHNQHLIEPVLVNNNFIAVEKTTNYSSLIMFDQQGNKIKTLLNGNTNNVDTMNWATDPAISSNKTSLAYVSDKDRLQTNVPDNALYILNLQNGTSASIINPDPYSGGIAHPIFDPTNPNILLYDYYQYDPQTLTPYSTIEDYNKQTGQTTTLTFENKNAYQASFSPEGKQLLFLSRNNDSNNTTLYIADIRDTGLINLQPLATGDFAYPVFSNTKNHIYYLQAEGNKGYNLMRATIQKNKLINPLPIITGFQLLGNSSYVVEKL